MTEHLLPPQVKRCYRQPVCVPDRSHQLLPLASLQVHRPHVRAVPRPYGPALFWRPVQVAAGNSVATPQHAARLGVLTRVLLAAQL